MKRIKLNFGSNHFCRNYEVCIGKGIVRDIGRLVDYGATAKIFIIADSVLKNETKRLKQGLKRCGYHVTVISVMAGERIKEIDSIGPIYDELIEKKADRDSVIVALGGGSIGDVAGFVASTFLRGIKWVGVPTTLLAQVDSSIGGKTGINHRDAKNMIGSIYQPSLVVCDVNFLKTLSQRDYISGLGEVVKYALALDPALFSFLEKNIDSILQRDESLLISIIEKCAALKARIVVADELDKIGVREVLNFGHTIGHALEKVLGYGKVRHGEAVIVGMRAASAISRIRGLLDDKTYHRIDNFLSQFTIPGSFGKIGFEKLKFTLRKDKKVKGEKVRFVLLRRIGETISDPNVKAFEIYNALQMIGVPIL